MPSGLVPRILHEDANLIVLDKPCGLLSQGESSGAPNVVNWLRARLGRPYVGLVHRLDRGTSGLMVVAKRSKAANRLTEALREGTLERSYQAWVRGELTAPFHWSHRLSKDEATNRVRVVKTVQAGVEPRGSRCKEARLSGRPLGRGLWRTTPLTLVELVLETGRSHQIRVQAAFEGFPLLGDAKYGRASDGFSRLALHSARLRFPHPIGGELLAFESPLPPELSVLSRGPRIEG